MSQAAETLKMKWASELQLSPALKDFLAGTSGSHELKNHTLRTRLTSLLTIHCTGEVVRALLQLVHVKEPDNHWMCNFGRSLLHVWVVRHTMTSVICAKSISCEEAECCCGTVDDVVTCYSVLVMGSETCLA